MAVEASRVTVTDVAELLFDATGGDSQGGASAVLIPVTGTAVVYLGGAGVTAADGAAWDPALGPLSVELARGEALYAVTGAAVAAQDVHVLGFGK